MTRELARSANLDRFIAELGDVPWSTEAALVRQKSRDFFWYSPILKAQLDHCTGDILVTPRSERDVIEVARLCVGHHLPLTIRGGGTGNYGQAVPLEGGVILDMSQLCDVGEIVDGIITVQPGAKLRDIEKVARGQGWELRLYPSTQRTATIGGFVGGGSIGIGAINYGLLADGGLTSLRIVTMEDAPRVLELGGAEVNRVHHAYGTNGIITRIRLPLEAAREWVDVATAFADFAALATFCQRVGEDPAIMKKLVTAVAWPIPQYFRTLNAELPHGQALGLFMVDARTLPAFETLLAGHEGREVYRMGEAEVAASGQPPLYEYSWNHTTLQALKVDRGITYLQTLFAAPDHLQGIARMVEAFGDEVPMHLEFVRLRGEVCCFGLQLLRFTTPERLAEIIRIHEDSGYPIFNPHTYVLEDGGMKQTDPDQLAFKQLADPGGLLNPGKMRGWEDIRRANLGQPE